MRQASRSSLWAPGMYGANEPMGYKGLSGGCGPEACALYKEVIDKHLPPGYSEVIISIQAIGTATPRWAQRMIPAKEARCSLQLSAKTRCGVTIMKCRVLIGFVAHVDRGWGHICTAHLEPL